MASIPDIDSKPSSSTEASASSPNNDQIETAKTEIPIETGPKVASTEPSAGVQEAQAIPPTSQANESDCQTPIGQDEHDNKANSGVKACEDVNYRKYFKMLQFGVPAPAVKLKMTNDGRDPNILE